MAVPKKRTSKSKCKSRKAQWKHKAYDICKKSISLGKSVIKGKANSFIYIQEKKENN
uniref:Large ribosomal subunit protein bL32c n=1 Tax=Gracilaria ferox TaxID=1184158 RepID=A0A345U6Z3_9FLOR|nr:ribosomal protein L32 [Gracilaria ferox]YP_010196480.1 ribosomal protein L32 [Gracilaria cervicornis]AXI96229.1 ribosomal protein L32 [Gracilaria ferox]UAD83877.1 ribosomal protein L32 [Gracilaria cervicornis]UAD85713.1 ribosomal protein L32 [Gracilaria ferox]